MIFHIIYDCNSVNIKIREMDQSNIDEFNQEQQEIKSRKYNYNLLFLKIWHNKDTGKYFIINK
ncbi:hypothetical protein psyc5s11_42180 [Clostridium gelidum]|uniref:Uncharacterized protein n=1 Tax=Clostridium gelidum TaxID=704125 RepID=A0ABM7T838_9CLOT|nr:hypothetical protein psyc5s11_42180 [Clostridium gelidum]